MHHIKHSGELDFSGSTISNFCKPESFYERSLLHVRLLTFMFHAEAREIEEWIGKKFVILKTQNRRFCSIQDI